MREPGRPMDRGRYIPWLCENVANQFIVNIPAQEVAMGRFVEGDDRAQGLFCLPVLKTISMRIIWFACSMRMLMR